MSEPNTPLHAGPDAQNDLDALAELDDADILDLDLDPGIDDSPSVPDLRALNTQQEQEHTLSPLNPKKRTLEASPAPVFDNAHDYQPRVDFTSPFSPSHNILKAAEDSNADHPPQPRSRRLSMPQQSRFVSYVDSRLMEIQRKFVQSRGLSPEKGYPSLIELLHDIKALVDFIWYSIDGTPHTDHLLQQPLPEVPEEPEVGHGTTATPKSAADFGQASFLIRIADDLLDYVEKFPISDDALVDETHNGGETIPKLFKLFFILDRVFRALISGANNNAIRLNGTDKIRFVGIAERTRMRLPAYFEHNGVHGYHFELSKIYEHSLDACSC